MRAHGRKLLAFVLAAALLGTTAAFAEGVPAPNGELPGISKDPKKYNYFLQGVSVVVKEVGGKTCIFDATGAEVLRDDQGNPCEMTASAAAGAQLFGGGPGNFTTDAQTVIRVESGTLKAVYCGGSTSGTTTTGDFSVEVLGGRVANVYSAGVGGTLEGDTSVSVTGGEVTNISGAGYNGHHVGNAVISVTNAAVGTIYGANLNGTGKLTGSAEITLDNAAVGALYGAGKKDGDVTGTLGITLANGSTVGLFRPASSANGKTVSGTVNVHLYEGYDWEGLNPDRLENLHLFVNGEEVFDTGGSGGTGEPRVTINQGANTNYYLNGIPAVIKETGGKTGLYDETGATLLKDTAGKDCVLPGDSGAKVQVFGGSLNQPLTGNPRIVMQSGMVKGIYGGSNGGDITGDISVSITGGSVTGGVYAGSYSGAVSGNVELSIRDMADIPTVSGSGWSGAVGGDVRIALTDSRVGTLYGTNAGQTGSGSVRSLSIRIDGGGLNALYAGKTITVSGNAEIELANGAAVAGNFWPGHSGSSGKALVGGVAEVLLPAGADPAMVDKRGASNIYVYVDGREIGGIEVTANGVDIFANGRAVVLKADPSDGKTYLYNAIGTRKLWDEPVDGKAVYAGGATGTVASGSIIMESGRAARLSGGGKAGRISGNAAITVAAGADVGRIDPLGGGVLGSVLIQVPNGFDTAKITPRAANVRVYVDGKEEVPAIEAPGTVTLSENGTEVFANGIPIRIREGANGMTAIYDGTGTLLLLEEDPARSWTAIYGGAEYAPVDSTQVVMEGGRIYYLYGGGKRGPVLGDIYLEISGGVVESVVHGGCGDADVHGSVTAVTNGMSVAKAFRGGCAYGSVYGNVELRVAGSQVKSVMGGSSGAPDGLHPSPDIFGNVTMTVLNWEGEYIYGGCANGAVRGGVTMYLAGANGYLDTSKIYPLQKKDSTGTADSVRGQATVYLAGDIDPSRVSPQGDPRVTVVPWEPEAGPLHPVTSVKNDAVYGAAADAGKLVYRLLELPQVGDSSKRTGDAMFIRFPDGQTMLVDAGVATLGDHLVEMLKKLGVTRIDYLVASHFHSDHIGGFPAVIESFEVGKVCMPPENISSDPAYALMMQAIREKELPVERLYRGKTLDIGGVHIDILGPNVDAGGSIILTGASNEEKLNNSSVLMRLEYQGKSALLTGDLYMEGEEELLNAYRGDPGILDVDLLKVPHHGDTTSSKRAFILAASLEIAVIPNFRRQDTVLSRYLAAGADAYITRECGTIRIVLGVENEVSFENLRQSRSPGAALDRVDVRYERGTDQPASLTLTLDSGYAFAGLSQNRSFVDGTAYEVQSVPGADGSTAVTVTLSAAFLNGLTNPKTELGLHYHQQGSTDGTPGLAFYAIWSEGIAEEPVPEPDPAPAPRPAPGYAPSDSAPGAPAAPERIDAAQALKQLAESAGDKVEMRLSQPDTVGAPLFAAAKQTGKSLIFTVVDPQTGREQYTWSFASGELNLPQIATSLAIELADVAGADGAPFAGKAGLLVRFGHSGVLPGRAEITLNVGDVFPDGTRLWYYYWNPAAEMPELMAQGLLVENGKVALSQEHCSEYLLTAGPIPTATRNPATGGRLLWPAGGIMLLLSIGFGAAAWVLRQKTRLLK